MSHKSIKMSRILILLFFFNVSFSLYAQKVEFFISLNDSTNINASDWVFNVWIKNNKLKKYRVQDTAILKERISAPFTNLLVPYVERSEGGKYVQYENGLSMGVPIPTYDTCFWNCCNCTDLKKGESMQLKLKILQPYKLKKGKYRMLARLSTPTVGCKGCKFKGQVLSNYLYFDVL
jgi:hypothetical protein